MPRANLTGTFIQTIKVVNRTDFQDEKQNGLVLRASPSGVMAWTVIYTDRETGLKQRATLGKWPDMDTPRARAAALVALRAVQEGKNPSKDKRARREAKTVKQLGQSFIENYAKARKRTWQEDERILESIIYPALGNIRVTALKRRDIVDMLDKKAKTAPAMADHALALLRKLLNWAVERGAAQVNPASGISRRAPIVTKDRVLSHSELKALWEGLPAIHAEAGAVFALLALTGQRLGEVCGMRAGEVDLAAKTWTIPSSRTKNRLVHIVPLAEAAISVLAARVEGRSPMDPVLSRGSRPMDIRYIGKLARGIQGGTNKWTPHDLRRTVATGMAALEIPPHVIEAVLNHISGAKAGVAGIYNRHSYAAEKRRAIETWATHLQRTVESVQS